MQTACRSTTGYLDGLCKASVQGASLGAKRADARRRDWTASYARRPATSRNVPGWTDSDGSCRPTDQKVRRSAHVSPPCQRRQPSCMPAAGRRGGAESSPMSLLSRLLGQRSAAPQDSSVPDNPHEREGPPQLEVVLRGGTHDLEVVGESHYQDALWQVIGGRT